MAQFGPGRELGIQVLHGPGPGTHGLRILWVGRGGRKGAQSCQPRIVNVIIPDPRVLAVEDAADRQQVMLVGQTVAERHAICVQEARDQLGNDLIVAKRRERHIQAGRFPPDHLAGPKSREGHQASTGYGQKPPARMPSYPSRILPAHGERARQLHLRPAERRIEKVAMDALHAQLSGQQAGLQIRQRLSIWHVRR